MLINLRLSRVEILFRFYFLAPPILAMIDVRSDKGRIMSEGNVGGLFAVENTEALELDVSIDSPAIRRLIEEVRAEEFDVPRSYNRTFNRHNR